VGEEEEEEEEVVEGGGREEGAGKSEVDEAGSRGRITG